MDSNVFDIADHPHDVYFAIKHFLKNRLLTLYGRLLEAVKKKNRMPRIFYR